MAANNEKFPPTPEGIQDAIKNTPDEMGFWEEKVDWAAEKDYIVPRYDQMLALVALRQTVIEEPGLFTPEEIDQINQALETYGLGYSP